MDAIALNQISAMLNQAELRIAEFQRDTYEESFQRYLEDNASVWNQLMSIGAQECSAQEQEQERAGVADCLARKAEEMLADAKNRTKRETMQMNLNLYMVSYFLPAIVAYQRRSGAKEEDMKKLTAAICDRWALSFKNHIQVSDYESIKAGFKQKLCFVTTAVCRGLHKPQDCRELTLMKRYRDEYLMNQEDGDAVIHEYYDIAPTIVKRIAKEASPEEKYLYLWNHYIKKCVELVEQSRNEQCREVYERMMTELREEYLVTNRKAADSDAHACEMEG